jgi:hypothetical protein
MPTTKETTQVKEENQINHYAIRGRIELMKQNHSQLKYFNRYLAKRLRRSPGAISRALNGERPTLLNRISRHLDTLQKKSNAS